MTTTLDVEVGLEHESQRDHGLAAPVSDEALMLAYRDRADRRAFEELVHRYERDLYSYLSRYIGNPTLAEDAF